MKTLLFLGILGWAIISFMDADKRDESVKEIAKKEVIVEHTQHKVVEKEKEKKVDLKPKVIKPKISKGTVWKDKTSGLVWQIELSKKPYKWKDAKKYCHNLDFAGYTSWKLPTQKELLSLMTKESYKNSKSNVGKTHIKKPLQKSMNMEWQTFWSATESQNNPSNAWNIYFDYGSGEYYDKSNENYVRCVLKKK